MISQDTKELAKIKMALAKNREILYTLEEPHQRIEKVYLSQTIKGHVLCRLAESNRATFLPYSLIKA